MLDVVSFYLACIEMTIVVFFYLPLIMCAKAILASCMPLLLTGTLSYSTVTHASSKENGSPDGVTEERLQELSKYEYDLKDRILSGEFTVGGSK